MSAIGKTAGNHRMTCCDRLDPFALPSPPSPNPDAGAQRRTRIESPTTSDDAPLTTAFGSPKTGVRRPCWPQKTG